MQIKVGSRVTIVRQGELDRDGTVTGVTPDTGHLNVRFDDNTQIANASHVSSNLPSTAQWFTGSKSETLYPEQPGKDSIDVNE